MNTETLIWHHVPWYQATGHLMAGWWHWTSSIMKGDMVLTEIAVHSRYGPAFPIHQEDFRKTILGLLNAFFTLRASHMILLLIKKSISTAAWCPCIKGLGLNFWRSLPQLREVSIRQAVSLAHRYRLALCDLHKFQRFNFTNLYPWSFNPRGGSCSLQLRLSWYLKLCFFLFSGT